MPTISLQSANPYYDEIKHHGSNEAINIMDYLWKKENNQKASYIDLFEKFKFKYENEFASWNFFLHDTVDIFNTQHQFEKSNKKSIEFLEQGHQKFKVENWSGAMESYNQSLCFAEVGSEYESLAYAGRSACFFHMEFYGKAMNDIEMSLKNDEIQRNTTMMQRLENRRGECIKKIRYGMQLEKPIPKLSFTADERYPCMANVLEIRENDEFGRYIVAKCDIDVGKTVMVSRVYASGNHIKIYQNTCREYLH